MNPRKVVFFNGPPHSGKDTIVEMLDRGRPSSHLKFATPLKVQCAVLLEITIEELEKIKDKPHPALKGGTPRQYLINLSEKMIKPIYGRDFFGHVAMHRINELPAFVPLVMFSDSGFVEEAIPVVSQVGLLNCVRIELYRPGTSFVGDSRNYWDYPGMLSLKVQNDSTLTIFKKDVLDFLSANSFI